MTRSHIETITSGQDQMLLHLPLASHRRKGAPCSNIQPLQDDRMRRIEAPDECNPINLYFCRKVIGSFGAFVPAHRIVLMTESHGTSDRDSYSLIGTLHRRMVTTDWLW